MRGRIRLRAGTERLQQYRSAYDPLEPVEPEPWSGGVGLEFEGAELELDGTAGAGDTGFGPTWPAGAAGVIGRGAIEEVPTCAGVGAGEGVEGPEDGVETGRGGAGDGT
jgi:hypothetical protein